MTIDSLMDEVFAAPTDAEQGRRFEMLARWILENAPEYRDRFSNVWSWADSPLYDGPDMGIDLVVRLSDGSGHWAVPCRALRGSVTKRGVDSFQLLNGLRVRCRLGGSRGRVTVYSKGRRSAPI